jgi:protein-S-isoprenylcysteine O-methyltransferase Ste14
VTLAFHAFVVLYEEPALMGAFGPSWSEYANRVPRWVGVRRRR